MYFWYFKEAVEGAQSWVQTSRHCKMQKKIITCCVFHIFLLNLMVRNHVRAGRGYPIGKSGLWLSGHTVNVDNNTTDRLLLIQFGMRRKLLANHLCVFQKKGAIAEDN